MHTGMPRGTRPRHANKGTHQDLPPELNDVGERRDDLGQPEQAADEVCMRRNQARRIVKPSNAVSR